jgi:hypothetical protein
VHEVVLNLHMHTRYSDGHSSHDLIAMAALKSGLDAVIVTDHNVWVNGPEKYYREGERKVLMLVGEEVHDQGRNPQKNHLLVFGGQRELATYAHDLQLLLERVNEAGGLAFIAHPYDPASPAVGETDITWVDWDVRGFHGLEVWNWFSEFKGNLKSKLHAIYYAYNPELSGFGVDPAALCKWDALLAQGRKMVAIAGSDAHALPARLGPLRRTLFPYEFHFRAVNMHLLLPRPLGDDAATDAGMIYDALRQGHGFIGYDLPASTRGFNITVHATEKIGGMGDEFFVKGGVTIQIRLPMKVECTVFRDGQPVKTYHKREMCTYITAEPGVYRVEAYIHYKGKRRGWIYSNPVYIRSN